MDTGERKKRKKDDHLPPAAAAAGQEEEEEENEDEKMEKFFALIRSTRDVKERLSTMAGGATTANRNHNVGTSKDGKTANKPPPPPVDVWYPTFQPEDFMEDQQSNQPDPPPPPPPPPHLNLDININPNTTHDAGEEKEEPAVAGPSSRETEEADGEDHHDLDLKLSL